MRYSLYLLCEILCHDASLFLLLFMLPCSKETSADEWASPWTLNNLLGCATVKQRHTLFHYSIPAVFSRWDLWVGFSEHAEIKKHSQHFVLPRVILLTKEAQTWSLVEQLSLVTHPSLHPLLRALFMVLSLRLASSCSGLLNITAATGSVACPTPSTTWLDYVLPYTSKVMSLPAKSAGLHQRSRGNTTPERHVLRSVVKSWEYYSNPFMM